MPVALYQRMPQLPTMSSNGQTIPRIWLPEAIVDGKAEGYRWVGKSIEHQFAKFAYPAPGHSPVKMLYKYGGPILSTINHSNPHLPLYPTGLHQFRAGRHQRMGGARRLRPPRPAAAQPPGHHPAVQGDRAAWRIEVRLLDLQRALQTARPRQLFLRRLQRDRLGEAGLSRLR